jgi:hypothetical protein
MKCESFNLSGDSFDPSMAFILGRCAYDIGTPVVKWDDEDGYDGYKRPLRVKPRKNGVEDIKQLLVHHSGQDRKDPKTMYRVLWDERRLSVHFALDEFAKPVGVLGAGPIIWQFVDCDYNAKHAGGMNLTSIGIEVCHYPCAWEGKHFGERGNPGYYSDKNNAKKNNVPHRIVKQPVHRKNLEVFAFTNAATDALARLYAGCWVAIGHQRKGGFEGEWEFSPRFPRDSNGDIPFSVVENPKKWIGLITHRQCSKRKWDPGGFDHDYFEDLVAEYYYSFRKGLTV